jgi:hypothetical protein
MKKSLLLILVVTMILLLSAGTAPAKSNHGHANGAGSEGQKASAAVQRPGDKQSPDQSQNLTEAQKGKKNRVQEKVKQNLRQEYKSCCLEKDQANAEKAKFSDIGKHGGVQYIESMTAVGLFKGYPDGTFKPDQALTQAEALALAMRVSAEDAAAASGDAITGEEDNEETDSESAIPAWVRDDVLKAAQKGIIKLNRFHSGVQASRAQTAVMIAKALGLKPADTSTIVFKDSILISQEDIGYIMVLYQEGIITGSPNGNFNPNKAITRAEMAAILQRLLNEREVESITLEDMVVVEQGKSVTLEAMVKYRDGSTDKQVSWSSSDTSLAAVSANGVVTAAADKTGEATITATAGDKSADCQVVVVKAETVVDAVLTATDNVGIRDGKVYMEYRLEANDNQISLAADQVKSITLQKDNEEPVELTPNADSTLWFNVQRETAEYTLKVVDNDDRVYTAVIDWTAPAEATATATGINKEENGETYAEYQLGDLNLASADGVYQIKPDGQAAQLEPQTDGSLWFMITNQASGEHVFLINQDKVWYTASITI